ncbi:MAG: transglutaminase family protein, partial [Burkholderiaceae bacterium]|nr:transglutaminase family protein [Burkholderiaceae bacterium]
MIETLNPPATATRSVTSQIDCGLSYALDGPCDFIFSIHATLSMGQTLLSESIAIDPPVAYRVNTDPASGNRLMRLHAEAGPLCLRYQATVVRPIEGIDVHAGEVRIDDLPDEVLHNLMTTRYCESDHLAAVAFKLFGGLPAGYVRVSAIT